MIDTVGDRGGNHPWFFYNGRPWRAYYSGRHGSGHTVIRNMVAERHPLDLLQAVRLYADLAWVGAHDVDVLAKPERASIGLPVLIRELGQLPQLVFRVGQGVIRDLARGNLTYQFGWRPLVSDLRKLLNIQAQIERKEVQLGKLFTKSGLRRKVSLPGPPDETLRARALVGDYWTGTFGWVTGSLTTQHKRWGVIRYKASDSFPKPPSNEVQAKIARRLAYGMHSSQQMANLWNIVPWTWLIDWFVKFGSIVENSGNRISTPVGGRVSICQTSKYKLHMSHTDANLNAGSIQFADGETVLKLRVPKSTFTIIPSAGSILSNGQMSILGSLAALRMGRFH
jgi:hypothetical protein